MIKLPIEELSTALVAGNYNDTSKFIVSIVPIYMDIITAKTPAMPKGKNTEYNVVGRITWLCKDNESNLCCITSSYVAETDDDREFLVNHPLLSNDYFINYSATADMLMSTLPNYHTNLEFIFKNFNDSVDSIDEPSIFLYGYEHIELVGNKSYKFKMIKVSPEVYSSFAFMDKCIRGAVINNADLWNVIKFGAQADSGPTYMINAQKVSIKDCCLIKQPKDYTKKVAARIEINDIYELILALNVPTKSKITNKAIKKVDFIDFTKDYFLEGTHRYVEKYRFADSVGAGQDGNDKQCIFFIRAKSRDDQRMLFIIDQKARETIYEQLDFLLND